MFGDISKAERIYIACGYTDMRKAIDGLIAVVQQNFQLNPFQSSLFLFCGRGMTGSKHSIGKKMGSFSSTSD